jgi:hypothetical protein
LGQYAWMDTAVQAYIDAIPPDRRPLFDRVTALVLDEFPDANVVLTYQIPTYVVGTRRLHVGSWKHGLSLYGWSSKGDNGFLDRHPELSSGRGTIRLSPAAAAAIADDEFRGLIRASLGT